MSSKILYLLRFFASIAWLFPYVGKATRESTINIKTSPTTPKSDKKGYLSPCSIQLRSGFLIHKGTKDSKPLVAIPSMIDVDMLYMQACFVRQLDTYPRIGLSVFWPHVFEKVQRLRWGILAYIELYQSDPDLSTWGHRISIGALKNGALASVTQQPNYSLMATKEITYHWLCAPSWQVNFGVGLLTHWWGNIAQGEGDTSQLKLAPLTTIGLRYIIHPDTFFRLASRRIYYKKQKNSRVDCSITTSSRKLASTQKYHFIVRGASLLSLPINPHNALLCSLELGYSQYKKALLASFFPAGGTEVTALLGYEIGYGRYLLQLQLGYQLTDATKTTIQTLQEDSLSDIINRKGSISVNLQYMVTKHFFVAISARSQEIPGIRVGISL